MLHFLKLRLTGGVFASEQRDTSAWMSFFNVHFGAFSDNYDDECIAPFAAYLGIYVGDECIAPFAAIFIHIIDE